MMFECVVCGDECPDKYMSGEPDVCIICDDADAFAQNLALLFIALGAIPVEETK